MAKSDKDSKKNKKKKKDVAKGAGIASVAPATTAAAAKIGKRIKTATENPLVADIVAAALVATAAALKDSSKARQLADEAGDELKKLEKSGAEAGSAMWQLALDIGRRVADGMTGEAGGERKAVAGGTGKASGKGKGKGKGKAKGGTNVNTKSKAKTARG